MTATAELRITTLAERLDLLPQLDAFPDTWPEFLYHSSSAVLYGAAVTAHARYCLIAVDPAAPDELVAKACAVPFGWAGDPDRDLPPDGYDGVLARASADLVAGRRGNLVGAIEVVVRAERRGTGISRLMLDAVRRNVRALGHTSLVVPVRPTRKHEHPEVPMAEYVGWTRDDGLPADPWLRVHVRAGARVVGVAPRSMMVAGSLAEWRGWTGLPFDGAGPVTVPGALVPAYCRTDADSVVYVEPNVWVHHRC